MSTCVPKGGHRQLYLGVSCMLEGNDSECHAVRVLSCAHKGFLLGVSVSFGSDDLILMYGLESLTQTYAAWQSMQAAAVNVNNMRHSARKSSKHNQRNEQSNTCLCVPDNIFSELAQKPSDDPPGPLRGRKTCLDRRGGTLLPHNIHICKIHPVSAVPHMNNLQLQSAAPQPHPSSMTSSSSRSSSSSSSFSVWKAVLNKVVAACHELLQLSSYRCSNRHQREARRRAAASSRGCPPLCRCCRSAAACAADDAHKATQHSNDAN